MGEWDGWLNGWRKRAKRSSIRPSKTCPFSVGQRQRLVAENGDMKKGEHALRSEVRTGADKDAEIWFKSLDAK